ncbi:MAG: hypothetical protein V1801_01160 [Candidatus Falkowbacteria bacterium]
MSDFQQTIDLRGKMERSKKAVPPGKPITPLEKIYHDEDAAKPKTDLKKISQPKIKEPREGLVKLIVFILAFLIIGFTAYSLFFKDNGWFNKPAEAPVWYAVKLVNGEIFYGQIFDTKADPVVMANVYYNYDQAKEKDGSKTVDETGNLRLVKRGQETHGPDGTMDIVRSQILLMEPLKSDSKVLQAILNYEK